MAVLIGDNGNYLEFTDYAVGECWDEYTPPRTVDVHVKSGAFEGMTTIRVWPTRMARLYAELFCLCEDYSGSTEIEHEDLDEENETKIVFAYNSRGYVLVSGEVQGRLWLGDENRLSFGFEAPVGNFDEFLNELKSEMDAVDIEK